MVSLLYTATPVDASADRTFRRAWFADDDDRVLRRAESVLDLDAEAAAELLDVLIVGLVTERHPQRIVGVVIAFGGGQDVGERLADVVHIRGAVTADCRRGSCSPRTSPARSRRRRHTAGAHPATTALE